MERCCCLVAKSSSFASAWTTAHQAPLSMGFHRQEQWSALPFPSPGDLPDPGIKLVSPVLAGRFFTTKSPASDIKQNEIMPFEVTWIDLETVILSEVSQIEKDKYHMTSLIHGI